jgi:hypothetical protein
VQQYLDPSGHAAYGTDVVRDEQVRKIELVLQALEQPGDLRPGRPVQRRCGLVEHDEPGISDDRTGNAHSLLLATAQLARVPITQPRVKAYQFQKLTGPLPAHGAIGFTLHEEWLLDRLEHRLLRVQGLIRLLENYLKARPKTTHFLMGSIC